MIYLVAILVTLVGLGKYLGSQQAAKQRRELATLRKQLRDSGGDLDTHEGETCRNEVP